MRFDFTDLRLFQFVIQTGSITRGAERAHLALASASARVRGMEEALGVPLLTRGRRGVEPTEAGRSLLDHARIVLQQIETMRGDLGAYSRGLKGSVRILANTSRAVGTPAGTAASFLAAHPTVDVDLEDRESPAIASPSGPARRISGSARRPPSFRGWNATPSGPTSGIGRAGEPPTGPQAQVQLRGAARSRIRRPAARGTALDDHVSMQAARLGRALRLRVRVNSLDAVCAMVAAGVGVGIVPETTLSRHRRVLPIAALRLSEAWSLRELSLIVRDSRRLTRPARLLYDALRKPG